MNKEGTKHKQPLHVHVSIEHLLALCCTVNLSIPFHAAVWALTLCTFFGCCRLGKLVVTAAAAFNAKYHVLCSVLCTFLFVFPLIVSYIFVGLLSVHYGMVLVLQTSIFLGPRQPRNSALL